MKEGELEGTQGAAVKVSTDSKKFLKKITPGHVGLVWSGNISVYVTRVEIEGMLDREWVEKTILKKKKRGKRIGLIVSLSLSRLASVSES